MSIARPLLLSLLIVVTACGTQESIVAPNRALNGEVSAFNNASIATGDANVIYDEAVDGDLLGPLETFLPTPDGFMSYPLASFAGATGGLSERLRLRLGTNVIRGTTFVATYSPWADFDAFTVDVPDGMVLRLDETTYGFHSLASSGDGRITDIGFLPSITSARPANADVVGNGRGVNQQPEADLTLATRSNPVVVDGQETASPLRIGFYNVINFGIDPNDPVRTLPAGTYLSR